MHAYCGSQTLTCNISALTASGGNSDFRVMLLKAANKIGVFFLRSRRTFVEAVTWNTACLLNIFPCEIVRAARPSPLPQENPASRTALLWFHLRDQEVAGIFTWSVSALPLGLDELKLWGPKIHPIWRKKLKKKRKKVTNFKFWPVQEKPGYNDHYSSNRIIVF